MKLIKGVVSYYSRKNRDKSLTFYARWLTREDEDAQSFPHCQRLFRTEADCKGKARRDADARARQTCNKLYDEIQWPDSRRKVVVTSTMQAAKAYMVWARATKSEFPAPMADSTADRQEQVILDFVNWVYNYKAGARRVYNISMSSVVAWTNYKVEDCKLHPQTVLTYLSDLQSWLDFCVENDWLERPLTLKRLRKRIRQSIREPSRHIPSTEEVNGAIKAQPDYLMRAAVFTLAATGLRSGELRSLTQRNLDLAGNLLKVNPSEREGFPTATKRHERVMPFGEVLGGILSRILPTREGPWLFGTSEGYKQLGAQLNHRLKRLDLKPHDFRRWFYSTLENMECESYLLADLLGHTGDKVRRAYSDGTEIELRRKWLVRIEAKLAWP